jgi:hypothetical protein
MRRRARVVLLGIAGFVLLVVLVGAYRTHVKYDAHVLCARCLQQAYVVEHRYFGLTVFRSVHPIARPYGLMSVALFSPETPEAGPGEYERIFGERCREHAFKAGGFSNTLRGRYHEDGASGEMLMFSARTQAIGLTFALHTRSGDAPVARETYALIDSMLPAEDVYSTDGRLSDRLRLFGWHYRALRDAADAAAIGQWVSRPELLQWPEPAELYALNALLGCVESGGEWREVVEQQATGPDPVVRLEAAKSFIEAKAARVSDPERAAALRDAAGRLAAVQEILESLDAVGPQSPAG